jgi:hypothetical protein
MAHGCTFGFGIRPPGAGSARFVLRHYDRAAQAAQHLKGRVMRADRARLATRSAVDHHRSAATGRS